MERVLWPCKKFGTECIKVKTVPLGDPLQAGDQDSLQRCEVGWFRLILSKLIKGYGLRIFSIVNRPGLFVGHIYFVQKCGILF